MVISTVLLIGILVVRRAGKDSTTRQQQQIKTRVLSSWEQCRFETISGKDDLAGLLDRVDIEKRTELSPLQERELRRTLVTTFLAFTAGSFEAYEEFLKPVPATINPARLTLMQKSISGEPVTLPESVFELPPELRGKKIPPMKRNPNPIKVPAEAQELLRLHFNIATENTSFLGWWQKLCTEQSLIIVEKSDSWPASFAQTLLENSRAYGTNYWGFADFSAIPIYIYSPTPRETLVGDGELIFASTRWLVALKPPDPVTPFLLRYYWNTKCGKWVPWELLLGNNERKTRIMPVF